MGNSVIYRPAYDAEVEYLESTGTQWIDTGFTAEGGCIVEYDCIHKSYNGGVIVGSHNPSDNTDNGYNRNMAFIYNSESVKFNKCDDYESLPYVCELNTRHTWYFNTIGYNRIGKIDGNVVVNATTTSVLHPVNNIVIFFSQYNLIVSSGVIYNLKIKSADNVLVRDMIPVRIGSIGYMYDKVSKQLFANKGTGNFILGNDVSNAVIPQQRCVFYSPMYDAQVEYLASTGTQWIDTKAENCKTFKFRFKALNAAADLKIFGNSVAYPKLADFTLYQSLFRGTSIPVESNTWYDVEIQELNPPTLKITKGVEVSTGTLPYSGNGKPNTSYGTELPIFGIISPKSNGPFYTGSYFINRTDKYMQNETYFSYFQAFDENGVMIRDFIPVRKGQVGYMYDKVSKQLFTNKGTGSFILGSDTNDAVASQRSVGFERIYEEYDWLIGDGSAYINTNHNVNEELEYETKCVLPEDGTYLLWYRTDTTNPIMIVKNSLSSGDEGRVRISNISSIVRLTPLTYLEISTDGTSIEINGTSNTVTKQPIYDMPLHLFHAEIEARAMPEVQNNYTTNGVRCAYFRFLDSERNYIQNLIPCRLLQSIPTILDGNGIARQAGECGMWDKVSGRFYGNVASSGSFTVSND